LRAAARVNPEGQASNERVIAAGYPLPVGRPLTADGAAYSGEHGVGNLESLYTTATTGAAAHRFGPEQYAEAIDTLIVDACVASRGHRTHLLGARSTGDVELEIGVGVAAGDQPDGPRVRSELQLVIETATRDDGGRFVLGVVHRDRDGDGAYDAGEGVAGEEVALPAAGVYTRTAPGGGYALPVAADVRGELVVGGRRLPVTVAGRNVKLDVALD
jgi:hypothetical protein